MSADDSRDVLGRLERLERSNRRWRRVALGIVGAGVLLFATLPQGPSLAQAPRVVAAQRFVQLSPGGQGHGATLEFTARGPELVLFDPGDRPRLRMAVDESGPSFHLLDARGGKRASLGLGEQAARVPRALNAHTPSVIRAGSSSASLRRTRKVTACSPSTSRWS